MIVKVKYYDEQIKGYAGQEYTYLTSLPMKKYMKVIAPTYKGDNKALVTQIDLPESTIDPAWADKLKYIVSYDTE